MTLNSSKLRIIVSGLIAQYPLGGISWHYFQYVLGLAQLGHDVYYIEDTGMYPYNPDEGGVSKGCELNVNYLANLMHRYGMSHKWAYCFPWNSQWFGMSDVVRQDVINSADMILNVSGTMQKPWTYRANNTLVYIDTDPVFTQIKLAKEQAYFQKVVDAHDITFSYGESMPTDMPESGHRWFPTRQPVVLSEWESQITPRNTYTTVMNWTSFKPIEYDGKQYGQKDVEFRKFMTLPELVAPIELEIAVNEGKTKGTPRHLLAHKGWRVVNPAEVCADFDQYRHYIQSSRAEWSVAKNGYVVGQSAWFSDRSACYLAAGRPVILQDTGFSRTLPVGEGLYAFTTLEEAVSAVRSVEAHYQHNAAAARAIAEAYFDSNKVLNEMIEIVTHGSTST